MATVNLLGHGGDFIVSIELPPFAELPAVVVWDTRVFKLRDPTGFEHRPDYVEVHAWFYLTPHTKKQVV